MYYVVNDQGMIVEEITTEEEKNKRQKENPLIKIIEIDEKLNYKKEEII